MNKLRDKVIKRVMVMSYEDIEAVQNFISRMKANSKPPEDKTIVEKVKALTEEQKHCINALMDELLSLNQSNVRGS